METSATRGCEHGRMCDDYCPECEIDGLSDTIVKLRAEITRLRADLKAATNERDAYHERLTELREELADAKQDKARLVNLLEEPNGILGSGFLPLDWRDDIRAALDDAKGE